MVRGREREREGERGKERDRGGGGGERESTQGVQPRPRRRSTAPVLVNFRNAFNLKTRLPSSRRGGKRNCCKYKFEPPPLSEYVFTVNICIVVLSNTIFTKIHSDCSRSPGRHRFPSPTEQHPGNKTNEKHWSTGWAVLRRNVKRFRGGLVFKAHRLVHHSTLGLRVMRKMKEEEGWAKKSRVRVARADRCRQLSRTPDIQQCSRHGTHLNGHQIVGR